MLQNAPSPASNSRVTPSLLPPILSAIAWGAQSAAQAALWPDHALELFCHPESAAAETICFSYELSSRHETAEETTHADYTQISGWTQISCCCRVLHLSRSDRRASVNLCLSV